jgi:hypothetical protein
VVAMSDSSDRDMERADIANGEGDPDSPLRRTPDRDAASSRGDDETVPPVQDPEAGYPSATGVVREDEDRLPPLGQELEAD